MSEVTSAKRTIAKFWDGLQHKTWHVPHAAVVLTAAYHGGLEAHLDAVAIANGAGWLAREWYQAIGRYCRSHAPPAGSRILIPLRAGAWNLKSHRDWAAPLLTGFMMAAWLGGPV